MAGSLSFDLFDKFGHLLPIAELEPHAAKLDPPTRKRFAAVKSAALASEAAIEATKQAQADVTAAMQRIKECEAALNAIRPRVDRIAAAREWMATTR